MSFTKGHPFYPGGEKAWFRKGHRTWNKGLHPPGKKHTEEAKEKIRRSKIELYKDKTKHPHYQFGKSYSTNYGRIHVWLHEIYGPPIKCENLNCDEKSSHYDYAKLSDKKYEPKRENYIMLCRKCHTRMDKKSKNFTLKIS